MAWTTPMTAVANATFTAAQFNTHVRDNLLETSPAKATAAGRIYVSTGANAIAERVIDADTVTTSQTTTSTSYTDLATTGPAVTVTTGARALVIIGAEMETTSSGALSAASVAVTGATTDAASDNRWLMWESAAANMGGSASRAHLFEALTPGSNVFTMRYRVTVGTASFANRHIVVVAL